MFSPTVLGTGPGGFAFLQRTREAQQAEFARSPQVARETREFLERLKDVKTADQLLDNRALLKVALGAFGLDEDINNRGFLLKILESDLTDGRSLANRLADKRYQAFALAFNFMGEGGPSLADPRSGDQLSADLAKIGSADALLKDRSLLRATLQTFGLEKDIDNSFFLKSVFDSDPADPASFAARLGDPRYAEMAETLGFGVRPPEKEGIYAFAALVSEQPGKILTSADLMANDALYAATLDIFGLGADEDRRSFIASVLDSDLRDPDSVANRLEDKRYAALARAFDFTERAAAEALGTPFESRLEKFVATVSSRTDPPETSKEFFADIRLMLDTFDFFHLPNRPDGVRFASRILDSDMSSPTSLINVFPDQRYRAFADSLALNEQTEERTYPAGFAETIVRNYLDRQFEIRIGESDPTMRSALVLERDLGQIIATGTSNDSRWFAIMASKPLRQVFETVFQLPASFGTLDIDRQLGDLKARSEQFFGTTAVADFARPELMETLRERFLARSGTETGGAATPGSLLLTLLSRG